METSLRYLTKRSPLIKGTGRNSPLKQSKQNFVRIDLDFKFVEIKISFSKQKRMVLSNSPIKFYVGFNILSKAETAIICPVGIRPSREKNERSKFKEKIQSIEKENIFNAGYIRKTLRFQHHLLMFSN